MSQLRYLLAFSGGLDSTLLLHLFAQALQDPTSQVELHAIHVHHGLQAEADDWVDHCRLLCAKWHVPLTVVSVDARPAHGESPEAAARQARYQAFSQHIDANTVLVTGHHQDDQVETVLLQLLRGAGGKGLSAMPEWKALNPGWHYRPLLGYARQQLEQLAHTWQLRWIEDPSNHQRQYARNTVRHDIVPIIAQTWPSYGKTIGRSARLLAQNQQLLQQYAQEQLRQLGASEEKLPLTDLLKFSLDRQALLVRTWLEWRHCPMPPEVKLLQFLRDLSQAGPDRHPCLTWAGYLFYRYRHALYGRLATLASTLKAIAWPDFPNPLRLDDHRHVRATRLATLGLRDLNARERQALHLRFWQQGGRFHPAGRQHSQSLKKLWQEWRVPAELRRTIPLVYCGDTLIAVVGYAIAKSWQADAGWLLQLEV